MHVSSIVTASNGNPRSADFSRRYSAITSEVGLSLNTKCLWWVDFKNSIVRLSESAKSVA